MEPQCAEASGGDNATIVSLASGSSYVFLYRYLLVYVYKYFIGGKDSLLLLKSQSWAALGVVYCVKKSTPPIFLSTRNNGNNGANKTTLYCLFTGKCLMVK